MADDDEFHNEITGAVRGNVLQIGNVHGDVVGWQQPSSPPGPKDSLHEPLWRLAREVRETSAEVVRTWGITSSDALPVRWRTATDLVDHWETIHDSTEPAALDGQFTAVRETYHAIHSKRLVIVGQAGAGKTVLAHRLILDLLDTDNATAPVPVLFSLSDWNPTTGETQADILVKENLILPVLDGFDEIPRQHHRPPSARSATSTRRWSSPVARRNPAKPRTRSKLSAAPQPSNSRTSLLKKLTSSYA